MPQVIIPDILPLTQAIAILNQTVYSTNWTANYPSDVVVYSRPTNTPADDATQILQYPSQYSVAFIGDQQTVQVTLVTPSNQYDVVTIIRQTPADRLNLYTNTNFTPTMLNQDFGIMTMVDQQAQLVDDQVGVHYNYSDFIEPVVDNILPILPANNIWVKNSTNTAITTLEVPASGFAPAGDAYILLTPDPAGLPNSFSLSTLTEGFLVNVPGTPTIISTSITGTVNQTVVTNGFGVGGSTNISIAPNPIIPGTAGMGIPTGTTAQRVIPTSGIGLRYNTTLQLLEYWTGAAWAQLDNNAGVLPGIANQLAYYATSGDQISGLALGNYGILISGPTGQPYWLANGVTGQVIGATTGGVVSWVNVAGGIGVDYTTNFLFMGG